MSLPKRPSPSNSETVTQFKRPRAFLVHDTSAVVRQQDQDEQEAVGRARDHEEIRGHESGRCDSLRTTAMSAMAAGVAESCIWRRWPGRPRCQVSGVRRGCEARPRAEFASDIVRISLRTTSGTVGRPVRPQLFQVQNKRKPRRCRAMTVAGLTMTRAVRHRVHRRDNQTQGQRSTFVTGSRRGIVRCSTSSWCRNARTSS
jgi:hypothetical protein